ncbi:unnamed protein product [Amoebophrya sp. A120]|nr:unnamed protein product [Amoebophrya sp. A120]|eukprot:GSA120T00016859001.1
MSSKRTTIMFDVPRGLFYFFVAATTLEFGSRHESSPPPASLGFATALSVKSFFYNSNARLTTSTASSSSGSSAPSFVPLSSSSSQHDRLNTRERPTDRRVLQASEAAVPGGRQTVRAPEQVRMSCGGMGISPNEAAGPSRNKSGTTTPLTSTDLRVFFALRWTGYKPNFFRQEVNNPSRGRKAPGTSKVLSTPVFPCAICLKEDIFSNADYHAPEDHPIDSSNRGQQGGTAAAPGEEEREQQSTQNKPRSSFSGGESSTIAGGASRVPFPSPSSSSSFSTLQPTTASRAWSLRSSSMTNVPEDEIFPHDRDEHEATCSQLRPQPVGSCVVRSSGHAVVQQQTLLPFTGRDESSVDVDRGEVISVDQ